MKIKDSELTLFVFCLVFTPIIIFWILQGDFVVPVNITFNIIFDAIAFVVFRIVLGIGGLGIGLILADMFIKRFGEMKGK